MGHTAPIRDFEKHCQKERYLVEELERRVNVAAVFGHIEECVSIHALVLSVLFRH